ncbi:DUF1803 domain-containing protein [Enterococcus sp. AZ109]|uniref:DUF1803 domain-containing protein n=1 Tax=Enterococcus sp. AZ109 TaxID=2774634 RepID=UPI003F1EC99E
MKLFTTNKQLQKSLLATQTLELFEYFYQLEQPVILREIRAAFPEDQQLDKRLDLLIQTGVVERKDRRYRLILTIYHEYPKNELSEQVEKLIDSSNLYMFVEMFYPTELTGLMAISFELPSRTIIENESYALVTLNKRSNWQATLPNYFYYQQKKRPKQFEALENLLGDVNPAFFFNHVEVLLDTLLQGKKPKKSSIFLKAMVMTSLVELEPTIQVNAPIVKSVESLDEIAKLWEKADEVTRYFAFYQLLDCLMGSKETLSYIIQKKD